MRGRLTTLLLGLGLMSGLVSSRPALAQLAPECAGVERPAGYREDRQQAFLHNYFAAAFLLTPLAPALAYRPGQVGVALELGWIPPLSCEQRLALNGTKTEQTNTFPVHPRPRLSMGLPALGPVEAFAGLTLVPPVPTPLGTLLEAGGELGVGWRSVSGLRLGLRGHLNFARVRAEIATPLIAGAAAYEDLFFTSSIGLDLGAALGLPWRGWRWLTPYLSLGVADVSSLAIIGDDLAVAQNVPSADGAVGPWWGMLAAGGLQARLLDEHLELVLEGSSALPVYSSVRVKLGVVW